MSVTTAYRRPAPAMQTSYGNSNPQMRGITSAAPPPASSSAALPRPHPVALAHPSQRYKRSSANAYNYRIEFNGTKADGKPREVIVIDDDTPEPSVDSRGSTAGRAGPSTSAAAPSHLPYNNANNNVKRRRPNGSSASVAVTTNQQPASYLSNQVYPPYAEPRSYYAAESSRRVAPSGVGGKRKAGESSHTSSKSRKEVAPPCDDKEGHYIVRPGETLRHGRYRIERLLGQGTFGKVVEALDSVTNEWVAVKIIRSIQKYRDASKVEIKVLNLLRERDPRNVNNCIHLVDWFDDRNHICIVTELLSVSVFDFLKENNYSPFPGSHIQHFAKQLLKSVAFLHDLRLVHTDLKPENILLVDSEAKTVPDERNPSRMHNVLMKSDIRLIDFGSATFEEEYHASVVSTRHYRAPEIILGMGWSFPCDVWSIGCILVEFFTGEALFQTHDNLEHLAMMEVVFGRMPDMVSRSGARNKPEWFRSTRLDFPKPDTSRQSRKYVRQMKTLEDIIPRKESLINSRFYDLLTRLLEWDANKRITVKEALRHPYFAINPSDQGTKIHQYPDAAVLPREA